MLHEWCFSQHRKHTQHDTHAAWNTYQGDGRNSTLERALKHHMSIDSTELPSSRDPSIEADNSKMATPRHVERDASVQGTSGAFLSTHFWTNYIDRVSPRAHDSRIGQTRVLATCVMVDPRTLYGMCSKADPCAARDFVILQSRARKCCS